METSLALPKLPRVVIAFCVQCKWNLRAAYFAQELLSTFATALGEVALQPAEGGIFTITLETEASVANSSTHLIWDRKVEGGFPETKELKRLVRDIIDPSRNLGHIDGKKSTSTTTPLSPSAPPSNVDSTKSQPSPPRTLTKPQSPSSERKFTPMDVDPSSRPPSSLDTPSTESQQINSEKEPEPEKEVVNSRGKIVIGGSGEGFGFCRPGEDCEDCG